MMAFHPDSNLFAQKKSRYTYIYIYMGNLLLGLECFPGVLNMGKWKMVESL